MAVLECGEGLGQALPGDLGLRGWDLPQGTWVKGCGVSCQMDGEAWTQSR